MPLSICVLIDGLEAFKISRNAASAGLWVDFFQATHKGIPADFGSIGRTTVCGRARLRTQLGMSETPSPLSTNVITVAMKLG